MQMTWTTIVGVQVKQKIFQHSLLDPYLGLLSKPWHHSNQSGHDMMHAISASYHDSNWYWTELTWSMAFVNTIWSYTCLLSVGYWYLELLRLLMNKLWLNTSSGSVTTVNISYPANVKKNFVWLCLVYYFNIVIIFLPPPLFKKNIIKLFGTLVSKKYSS